MRPFLLPLLVALPAVALAQVPFEPEFRVNAYTQLSQGMPRVGADATGLFVVVWFRDHGAGDETGIFGQRLDSAGRPLGGEFLVSSVTTGVQYPPSLAGAGDGSFVVTWATTILVPQTGIIARRFNASGVPLGGEFRVNTFSEFLPYDPVVAMDAAGAFVVVWTDPSEDGSGSTVLGQRFETSGNRRGSEFRVNGITTGFQQWPSVSVAPDGTFMVVWASSYGGGDSWEIYGRRYDTQGQPGPEMHLNSYTTSFQFSPEVSLDGAGHFVVVWTDDDRDVIAGRRFDTGGNPLGAEFTIPGVVAYNTPLNLSVAADPPGFVVVWEDYGIDTSDIYARRFDAAGAPGPTFLVNRYRTGHQKHPDAATLPGRGLVLTWAGYDYFGAPSGIFARRVADLGPSALAVDTSPGTASDGNGVLEAGETIAMAPAWRNSTAATRPATGTLSQMTGPGSPALYSIVDADAAYTIPPNAASSCAATANCYAVAVGVPPTRPAVHWDARVREEAVATSIQLPAFWDLHVGDSFTDVPRSNPFYRFVETLLHHGVANGCQGGLYCPQSVATREQMAVFVLAGLEPAWFVPFHCTAGHEYFDDVPASNPFCPWVEELFRRQVTFGCGGGNYCPAAPVTREQMAVFVLRALDPGLDPPACGTPVFADVPASSPFCRWIEELARRGVVSGCGGGNYCPAAPVSRAQMSVFITVTFGLTLYGP